MPINNLLFSKEDYVNVCCEYDSYPQLNPLQMSLLDVLRHRASTNPDHLLYSIASVKSTEAEVSGKGRLNRAHDKSRTEVESREGMIAIHVIITNYSIHSL